MIPFKKVLMLIFCCTMLMTLYFCESDSSTDPDPEPVTLEGEWAIETFATMVNDYQQTFIAPEQIFSNLIIQDDKFWENGQILNIAFTDSGTISEDVDSLQFFSWVHHKTFMGKLLNYALVINKTIKYGDEDYIGTAMYVK